VYDSWFAHLSPPRSGGTSFTQRHDILSQNTGDARLSRDENPESLSHLVLERYQDATPGWMDGQTDRQTELP